MEVMDLGYLRDLLGLLSEYRVQAFVKDGMQIAFREDETPALSPRIIKELDKDDGHSTSPRRVGGFSSANADSFRGAFTHQNGKMLTFTGEYE